MKCPTIGLWWALLSFPSPIKISKKERKYRSFFLPLLSHILPNKSATFLSWAIEVILFFFCACLGGGLEAFRLKAFFVSFLPFHISYTVLPTIVQHTGFLFCTWNWFLCIFDEITFGTLRSTLLFWALTWLLWNVNLQIVITFTEPQTAGG